MSDDDACGRPALRYDNAEARPLNRIKNRNNKQIWQIVTWIDLNRLSRRP